MTALLWLVALPPAVALDRPVLDMAADTTCPARGVKATVALVPPCDGIVLSMARAKWYTEMADYADYLQDMRALDAAAQHDALVAADERTAYWKALATAPPPTITPAGWFGIGAGTGVVTVLLGALAVRAVAEAPLYTTP